MIDERAIGDLPPPDRLRRLVATARSAVSHVLAGFLLFAALVVWLRLFGLNPFGGATFATAEPGERAMLVSFSALVPVAALGLWFVQTWGRVLWLAVVVLHCLAVTQGWASGPWTATLLASHAVSIAIFAAVEIAYLLDRRRPA